VQHSRGAVIGLNGDGFGWYLERVDVPGAAGPVVHTRTFYVVHSDVRGWLPYAAVNAAVINTFTNAYRALGEYLRTHYADRENTLVSAL
jgi:hypothetical protein